MSNPAENWTPWLRAHTPRLLLFARQQARREADAQDVLQEVLHECWSRDSSRPPDLPLVFAGIRHRAIDLARRADRRHHRESAAAPADEPHFDASPEDRERDAHLLAALSRLSPAHREVVSLKIWGELTFAEIGEVLSLPPPTAAHRYRAALAALRGTMKIHAQ